MQPNNISRSVPSLLQAQNALAQLATEDALEHLESAIRSLEGLSTSLQNRDRLQPAEQRLMERSLLRFRTELRDARILADQGLAYCQNWAQQMQPPPSYQANGIFVNAIESGHELSLEA